MEKLNSKYTILTPKGFSNFRGIRKVKRKGYVEIWTQTKYLKCSMHHFLKNNENVWKNAYLYNIGDEIQTIDGIEKIIDYYINFDKISTFYDPMNVSLNKQYFSNGFVSHNSEFMGSASTLISPQALQNMVAKKPINEIIGIKIFEQPKPERKYFITMDPSEGKGQDYHAFVVIDITERPFRVAATWRNKVMDPLLVPDIIYHAGKMYNDAFVLIETKSTGTQISDGLFYTKEYWNLLGSKNSGRLGQVLTNYKKEAKGLSISSVTKSVGCSNLRMIIENEQLIPNDFDLIEEFSHFSLNGNTFKADDGYHDDLVMCMVIFAWATTQKYFQNLSTVNIEEILAEKQNSIKETFLPMFLSDGIIGSDKELDIDEFEEEIWDRVEPNQGWL